MRCHFGKGKTMETVKDLWLPGVIKGSGGHRGFLEVSNLYAMMQCDRSQIVIVIIVVHRACNKPPALVWDVDTGVGCACIGPEGMGTLCTLLDFAVNLTALKKSVGEKKKVQAQTLSDLFKALQKNTTFMVISYSTA